MYSFERGVREHDRTDVASFDDPSPTLGHPLPLAADQFGAHSTVGCDRTDGRGDLASTDLDRGVDAVDRHAVVADHEIEPFGHVGDVVRVGRVEPTPERGERDRPVHRSGVEVLEPEPVGEGAPDRALPGPGRAVDRDHDRRALGGRIRHGTRHQDTPSGRPSSYPAVLCTPTTARSWNSATVAAPA